MAKQHFLVITHCLTLMMNGKLIMTIMIRQCQLNIWKKNK